VVPLLELDALAIYALAPDGGSLSLEHVSGMAEAALSPTTIAGAVADLKSAGRRTLALDKLQSSMDPRAAPLRDLGFTSAVVGALFINDRTLGAVVLATRAKERFSAVEHAFVEAFMCYLAAAYERR